MTEPLPPAFDAWLVSRCPDIRPPDARAVLDLAAEGATVPFIVRYRRERTGNLAEAAVRRTLEAKELFQRILSRQTIIRESIERHARLTPELAERIGATFDLDALEDLYHPYRQQKKNRALEAREAGLEPLADWIWDCGHGRETPQEGQTLELWAFTFRNEEKGIADAKAAVEGARDILVERIAGDAGLRARVRSAYFDGGWLRSARTDKAKAHGRFDAYFAFQEKVSSLREPSGSPRYLALRRGQSEGELQLALGGPPDDPEFEARLVADFESAACTVPDSPGAEVLRHAGRIAFKNDVRTSVENEVHRVLKDAADAAAARAFADSVRRTLLEAPFGKRPVLAILPGTRAGCGLAALDAAGTLVARDAFHLQTEDERASARETVVRLAREHGSAAVAVGDGTGGREAELVVRAALREAGIEVPVVLVSQAAASVWGTGEAARAELPELEPPVRSAVSLGRRLQDPLAELLRIEPRSLGAAPYQHDVPHAVVQRALDPVVESSVSSVGVDLNTAPRHLLARVPGLSPALAAAIVEHRETHGPFRSRRQLAEVPQLGPQALEQAAGFVRVAGGEHPLDVTAIHPERYAVLEAFAERGGRTVADLLGPGAALVREAQELKQELGPFTWESVVAELESPGRDPRGRFVPFAFREDVLRLEDLKPGMECPAIVTNVTSFGAFADIGVQHDGLVHVSQLAPQPGRDPKRAVHPGDRVLVRVLKVDLEKKQISLTMRRPPPQRKPAPSRRPAARPREQPAAPRPEATAARPLPKRTTTRRRPAERPSTEHSSAGRPSPERPRPARPERQPSPEKRPDSRRPAFNNPFAVLAGLKVPPKRDKS